MDGISDKKKKTILGLFIFDLKKKNVKECKKYLTFCPDLEFGDICFIHSLESKELFFLPSFTYTVISRAFLLTKIKRIEERIVH